MLLRVFVGVVLAGFLATRLPLPWTVAVLALGIAGIVLGILCAVKVFALRMPKILFLAVAAGLGASAILSIAGIGTVVFWPVLQEYQDCMATAITEQAKDQCLLNYQTTFKEITGVAGP